MYSQRLRKTVTLAFVLAVMIFVAPEPASSKMQCWDGGLHIWIDGYTYCMVSGDNCTYCEVVMLP